MGLSADFLQVCHVKSRFQNEPLSPSLLGIRAKNPEIDSDLPKSKRLGSLTVFLKASRKLTKSQRRVKRNYALCAFTKPAIPPSRQPPPAPAGPRKEC